MAGINELCMQHLCTFELRVCLFLLKSSGSYHATLLISHTKLQISDQLILETGIVEQICLPERLSQGSQHEKGACGSALPFFVRHRRQDVKEFEKLVCDAFYDSLSGNFYVI